MAGGVNDEAATEGNDVGAMEEDDVEGIGAAIDVAGGVDNCAAKADTDVAAISCFRFRR